MTRIASFLKDESGVSAAEYALILAVLFAAVAAGLVVLKSLTRA